MKDEYEIKLIEWPWNEPNPRNKYWIVEHRKERGYFPLHGPYEMTSTNKILCEGLIKSLKKLRGLK